MHTYTVREVQVCTECLLASSRMESFGIPISTFQRQNARATHINILVKELLASGQETNKANCVYIEDSAIERALHQYFEGTLDTRIAPHIYF